MNYWKSHNKFPEYEISNCGKIRRNGKILKQQIDKCGYLRVRISVSNTKYSLKMHREVAIHWIENPDNLPQVNHIDGNKQNNHQSNLEWINNSDNQIHAIQLGLKVIKFGEEAPNFKHKLKVYNKNHVHIDTLVGNRDMISKGYDPRLVNACLHGKRKTHRNCYFIKEENLCT